MKTQVLKAYKYRIYPNLEQRVLIEKHFGCARFVYNWALGLKKDFYEAAKKSLSRKDIQDALVSMKKKPEYEWLNEVNSQTLLSSLLHVHTAFGNFFAGRAAFPKFKSKKNPVRSYQCPQHCTVDFENKALNLPKLKGIKAVFSRTFEDKIKTVTVSKTATGKYYASILVETEQNQILSAVVEPDKTLGIDVGIEHLLNFSDGTKIANPRFIKESKESLATAQKILARKQLQSNNRHRQKKAVAKVHERTAQQRHDYLHKITHKLVSKNQATSFALEDLAVKNMLKNRKLSKAISDVAWGKLVTLLTYKATWAGKNILTIGRFEPSSKLCSCCGHKVDKLPLHIREWTCPNCKESLDRDTNASINIRNIALADALGY